MCIIEIQLRGYDQNIAVELKQCIYELIADKDYGGQIEISICPLNELDAPYKQEPLIRLLSNFFVPKKDVLGLLRLLQSMNEMVEHYVLEASFTRPFA